MSRRVILTEKPSVATDIAKALGSPVRRDGYIECDGYDGHFYRITWCNGHLLEIYTPLAKGEWTLDALPIIPDQMYLRPITDDKLPSKRPDESESDYRERLRGQNRSVQRLEVIRRLFEQADEIVAATDAGREGQSIFNNVYNYLGIKKPVWRFWNSSLTDEAIREAMENLEDNNSPRFRNLGIAAGLRAIADWRVGINATRAFSLSIGQKDEFNRIMTFSLGRVQTTMLRIICDRYEENANFVPQTYWYLEGECVKDGKTFSWRGEKRYDSKEEAAADLRMTDTAKMVAVDEVEKKRNTDQPPLLHDIGSLQKIANLRCGFSMEETLEAAQSLYLRKLISYPRTGSRYISEDLFTKVPSLLRKVKDHPEYGMMVQELLNTGKLNRRSVDDARLTDHHALVITGVKLPDDLTVTERKVYDLILLRFIEAFSSVCVSDTVKVSMNCNGVKFVARSRHDVSLGWRAIGRVGEFEDMDLDSVDDTDIQMIDLPNLYKGEYVKVQKVTLEEDKTRAKPLYTDATLLTALENAVKNSPDREAARILKDVGLGTPATRADIMVTLVKRRGYVRRSDKKLIPTDVGLVVYHAVRDSILANVNLTVQWEKKLHAIEIGEMEPRVFDEENKEFTKVVTDSVLHLSTLADTKAAVNKLLPVCPRCKHYMQTMEKKLWCNPKYEGCGLEIWRHYGHKAPFGVDLTDAALRRLVNEGRTRIVRGIKGRRTDENGKEVETNYEAVFELREDYTVDMITIYNKYKGSKWKN